MEEFKLITDALASGASFVAILAALIAWYQAARRPLRVKRVVVHRNNASAQFILIVQNSKDHPVEIKRTDCYRKKSYRVEKKTGAKPEYSELLLGSEMVFSLSKPFNIAPQAHTDIRFHVGQFGTEAAELLFVLDTSHGYHELWCKDIVVVDIGVGTLSSIDYQRDFQSKWVAKICYWWAMVWAAVKWLFSRRW